jgi:manganese transport protein
MDTAQGQSSGEKKVIKGLPMFGSIDPEALAKEKEHFAWLEKQPLLTRWKGYWSKTGPGWMQSAMTLGGGSAFASLYAGATMQYKLLWVQPLAMFLGIIMLSALSYQTMSTGARPFHAMKEYVSPALAWAWAIGALVATVIWHLPQYALASGMAEDIVKAFTGWEPTVRQSTWFLLGAGVVILFIATNVCWNYGKGRAGIKRFENIIKFMIWGFIVCFTIVVVMGTIKGKVEWGKVMKGFLPLYIPTESKEVSIFIAALSAAVGINMTFLFGYSYLARGWGKEHRGLARFDLLTGMWLPYTLATSLMVIATGCTIYNPGATETITKLSPVQAASLLEAAGIPMLISRLIFGIGIIGMAMNCITLHMLVSGFAVCEVFGIEPGGAKYKLACLIPAPGMLGVILWQKIGAWIAIPTSAVCLLLLPIAYVGFFLLNNSKKYLGDDKPKGTTAVVWNIAMLMAIGIIVVSAVYYTATSLVPFVKNKLF